MKYTNLPATAPGMTGNEATATIALALASLIEVGGSLPRLLERLEGSLEANAKAAAMLAIVEGGLHPDHVYQHNEAARFVGKKITSLYKEPETILPAVWSRGRKVGFKGIDLLCYRGDITPEEAKAYKEAQRQAVLAKANG